MFQTLKNAWKIPELKSKILFTLMIIILYRLGSNLPMPWVNPDALETMFGAGGSALSWWNTLSGGALAQATLFALSVSPYITASIVIQLLTIAIPKLENWAKEGESGKKKLSALTRGLTVALALVTAIGYTMLMANTNGMLSFNSLTGEAAWPTWQKGFAYTVLVLAYCAGASIIMWLAEKINEKGIGNGISIILFANIIARLPSMAGSLLTRCFRRWDVFFEKDNWRLFQWPIGGLLVLLFAAVLLAAVIAVVWFSNSERRIPVQYAKRVVGRKMYGGQSTTLPIKLDMAGVMPVIFASSIVSILPTIAGFIGNGAPKWLVACRDFINDYLGHTSFPYIAMQIILIVAFAYFYISISFNPVEVSNNLRNNGGAIPGIRPGKPTVDYIKKILNRITLLGAFFLCALSGLPMIVNAIWTAIDGTGIPDLAFSGTSLLIVVGVALETFRELEAQMTLRNYKGFLD